MKKIITSILLAGLSLASYAGSTTTTMTPTAKLNKTCVLSATNVAFGEYSALNPTEQLSTNTVTIKCTKGTGWNYYQYATYYYIPGVTDAVSAMLNGANKLYYQVQVADGNWDNDIDRPGSPNSGHFIGTGNGTNQTLTLNYRVFKNQFVKAGNYSDNVTAYIDF